MARLIDTNVFITLERRRGHLSDLYQALPDPRIAMSSITASELLYGLHRASVPEQRERRERFVEFLLSRVPVIPIDLDVARVHSRIWVDLEMQGVRIGDRDLLIAATALHYGYGVVTENRREFDRVPRLIVESPSWRDS